LVSGVPAAVSAGGAGGLPDLPREARGRGVVSDFGGRGMGEIYGVELRVEQRDARGIRSRRERKPRDVTKAQAGALVAQLVHGL
jgi:hypothetical protein